MSRGGYRPNSGRKKGSKAVRHQPIIADPDGLMPIDWLLAVLRDPKSEASRRDSIAIAVLPYLHPRLAQTTLTGTVNGGGDTITNNTVNIFAVPRGASLDLKEGKVSIEGSAVTALDPVEPFTGTAALSDQSGEQRAEPLPVQAVDTSNVTRLGMFLTLLLTWHGCDPFVRPCVGSTGPLG